MTGGDEPHRGLDSVLADVLADLANRSLDLDPASRARLTGLEGRRVQITTELPAALGSRDFALVVRGGRLRFLPHAPDAPHVVARGTPPDLLAWLVAGESPAGSRLVIDGDTTVLSELRAALAAFRPDFAQPLSRLVGDELAQNALGAAELALASLQSALQGAGAAVRDGAARTFVDRTAFEDFLDQLDHLRMRVDRLAARVDARERAS